MDTLMKALGFIGNRWTIYLGFIAMGLFGMFEPVAQAKLMNFFLVAVGVAGIVHAYNEGAFDKQIEELRERFSP